MSFIAGAKAIGKKLFGKKKPVDTKFKPDSTKEIDVKSLLGNLNSLPYFSVKEKQS